MTSSLTRYLPLLLATACNAGGAVPKDLELGTDGGGGTANPGAGGQSSAGGFAAAGGFTAATGGSTTATIPTTVIPTGDDGGTLPFAGYDPTVAFDWPVATTTAGSCKAGHYQGSFIGMYSPSIAVAPVPIPVAGNIDLTLTQSSNGEYFEITDGKVSGVADLLFPFSADVKGTLNCTTMQLENGFLSNGVYIVGVIPFPFEGPLTGEYDKVTHAFTKDTWTVGEPTWTTPPSPYGGSGTWEATWVGP